MSLTKANIIKAVQQATGIAPAIDKVNGTYYWRGEEASLFSDSCLYITGLNHPSITLDMFVESFNSKMADVEKEYSEPFDVVLANIKIAHYEPMSFSQKEEINTSPSRPIEPHSSGEDPETWADIAQWESDRADKAEAIASKLDKELARLQRVINGECGGNY